MNKQLHHNTNTSTKHKPTPQTPINYLDNDDKKRKAMKDIITHSNSFINYISKTYSSLFNTNDSNIQFIFYCIIILCYIQHVLVNLSKEFGIKSTISFCIFIPYVIILTSNYNMFKVSSLFEYKTLLFIFILTVLKKQMNFIEICLFSTLTHIIQTMFIKQLYINTSFLGVEIQNRHLYKMKTFENNFTLLLCSYIFISMFYVYFHNNNKLSFFIFDDILYLPSLSYYIILTYLSNRKFFHFLYRISQTTTSSTYEQIIPKAKIKFIIIICIQYIIMSIFVFERGLFIKQSLYVCLFAFLFIVIYENIGCLCLLLGTVIYICKHLFITYIDSNYTDEDKVIIYNNSFYMIISLLMSCLFIIAVYYMEYNNIGNIYNMIYQRIFILKVIFDIWLIINFIYKLYKDNPHTYFDSFCNVYRSIFMGFVLNYVFVFLCVGIKLFVYAKPSDVDYYFDNLVQYIANEKHKDTQINPIVYGSSTPYVEIKIYKTFRKFISRFENDESTLKTVHSKALIRIERFILIIISILLCIVIDNSIIYYIVYFILIQFMQGKFNILKHIIKQTYKCVVYISTYNTKSKRKGEITYDNKIKTLIPSHKYKLLYIIIYPYLVLIIKNIILILLLKGYECIIGKSQFYLLGKLEPVGNVCYQIIKIHVNNEINYKFGLKDLIVFVICILPNTVSLLKMHFGNKISFVNQNWLVLNLCGVFVNVHRWLIVIGVVNVFIMLNMYMVDEELYRDLSYWFDLFGITDTE